MITKDPATVGPEQRNSDEPLSQSDDIAQSLCLSA